jgi:hypothetical protein
VKKIKKKTVLATAATIAFLVSALTEVQFVRLVAANPVRVNLLEMPEEYTSTTQFVL